jgi:hypothetical protein
VRRGWLRTHKVIVVTGVVVGVVVGVVTAYAAALRLDLYRIDLSAVVGKYVGETEKNLRRLLDRAEDGGALLFFDEADDLFARRSEVKHSEDRDAIEKHSCCRFTWRIRADRRQPPGGLA